MTTASICPPALAFQGGSTYTSPPPLGAFGFSVSDICRPSGFTFDGNPVVPFRTIGSCFIHSFDIDFFNAIYFIPANILVDSISVETEVTATIWNAFRNPQTIATVVTTGADGIEVTGPQDGFNLGALGLFDYIIEISPAGPQELDFSLMVTLDNGAEAELSLTGQRASSFCFAPNWINGVQRTYSFNTDIARGRTQRESRRRLRARPRISFRYNHLSRATKTSGTKNLIRTLRAFMHGDPTNVVTMPDWTSSTQVSVDLPAGSTTLELSAVRPWTEEGTLIFIIDPNQDEIFSSSISSVQNAGTQLTLQSAFDVDIPKGAIVYRGVAGRVNERITANMVTDTTADVTIDFEVDPGQEELFDPPPATAFFQGREIFDVQENWANPPTLEFAQDRVVLDRGFGRIREETFFEHTPEVWNLNFTGLDLDEVFEIENFFRRMEGRAGEFWRSKRLSDFDAAAPISAGQNSLILEGSDIVDVYGNDPAHVALEIETTSGERLRRAIIDTEVITDVDGVTTTVIFNEPWLEDIALEDISRVSWFQLWRLATDNLTVRWLTDSVAEINLPMLSLVVENPE